MMRAALLAATLSLSLAVLPAGARTLVFCSEGNPESLDPARATTTTAMNATWQVFNNLVEFVPGTTTLRPALAESWEVSPDGRIYDFTLRPDVAFHANDRFTPSRPLDADDVLFTFLRQWKPDHPFYGAGSGAYVYFRDLGIADQLEGIEKLNARRVRFRLREPDATFLANLAQSFASIHSAEYADILRRTGVPEALTQAPIGTGPFRLVGYRPDQILRYRAFPEYWRRPATRDEPAGRVDELIFSITPNPAVRLTKLRAGECQVMAFPALADLPAIASDANLVLLSREELNVAYLAFNTRRPPLDDVRVRRAIGLAIDRAAIIDSVYPRAGTLARGPLPPGLWAHDETLPEPVFDRAAARRLLGQAGYPDGFETDLWFLPVSRPYNPNGRRVADLIQADLARVGIRVRPTTEEWGAYRTGLYAGLPTLMLYGWTSDNGDPDNFLNVLLGCKAAEPGGANVARWCDPDYDSAVRAARRTTDREARIRLYRQAQAIFAEQVPWVPLAHSLVHMALRREVTGFRMDPLSRHLFEDVRFER